MSDKMNSVNRMIKRITSLAAKIWPYCRRKKKHWYNLYTSATYIPFSFSSSFPFSVSHTYYANMYKLAQFHADICNSSLCYQHNIINLSSLPFSLYT